MRDSTVILTIILLVVGIGGILLYGEYNKPDVIVGEDYRDRSKINGSARGLYNPNNTNYGETACNINNHSANKECRERRAIPQYYNDKRDYKSTQTRSTRNTDEISEEVCSAALDFINSQIDSWEQTSENIRHAERLQNEYRSFGCR